MDVIHYHLLIISASNLILLNFYFHPLFVLIIFLSLSNYLSLFLSFSPDLFSSFFFIFFPTPILFVLLLLSELKKNGNVKVRE